MSTPEILIVAGEASGDHYGAELVHRIKEANPSVHFFGMGGDRMGSSGVELLHHIKEVSVMGFVEVLSRLGALYRAFRSLAEAASRRQPRAAVFIDFPDFNLRLAPRVKQLTGAPNIYYIGPTVWAWRAGRIDTIKRSIDRMLVIFPFEEPLYRDRGVEVEYVGHPLAGGVRATLGAEDFRGKFGIPEGRPLIGLLPGSRAREVEQILPVLRDSLGLIAAPGERAPVFALGLADSVERSLVEGVLAGGRHPVTVVERATSDLMQHADLLLVACGTAPLEAALLGTPQVVVYRTSPLTYGIASRMVKVEHICIVNLIAGRRAVPELVQDGFRPERVASEARRLLQDATAVSGQRQAFEEVRRKIGSPGAAKRAARAVLATAKLEDWSPAPGAP